MIEYLRPLAYFTAVIETGSITAAGEKLSLTTSVISRSVSELEKRLGVELLYRSGRRVLPTPAGMVLYRQSANLTKQVSSAIDQTLGFKEEPSGTLRATMPTAVTNWLAPLLFAFRKEYPEVKLDLILDDSHLDILDSEIDLALRLGQSGDETLVQRKVAEIDVILIASPDLWPADRDPNDISVVPEIPMIVRSRGKTPFTSSVRRRGDDQWVELSYEPFLKVTNSLASYRLAEAGVGAAFAMLPAVAEEIESGRLVQLLPDWEFGKADFFVVFPSRDPTPAAREFADLLIKMSKDYLAQFA